MIEEKTIGNISCKYTDYDDIGIYYNDNPIAVINVETEYIPIIKIFNFSYWILKDEDKKDFDEIIKYIAEYYK